MQMYIDFDGTLFDTDRYINDVLDILYEYGITKDKYEKVKKVLFNDVNLFNMNKLIDYLIEKDNIDIHLKNKVLKLLEKSYLYSEILKCLEILISNGCELYLLTYGDTEYQKVKIDSSNINNYFKEIIITEKDKSKLDLDYKNGIFIDNNPNEVEKFYKSMAKKVIRIRRNTDKYSKIDCKVLGIIECDDFNQVVKYMRGENLNG